MADKCPKCGCDHATAMNLLRGASAAIHAVYEEEERSNDWATSTFLSTFKIKIDEFLGIKNDGKE